MRTNEIVLPRGPAFIANAIKKGISVSCFLGSVAKLIVTLCYPQLVVFFVRERFNIWYSP